MDGGGRGDRPGVGIGGLLVQLRRRVEVVGTPSPLRELDCGLLGPHGVVLFQGLPLVALSDGWVGVGDEITEKHQGVGADSAQR